MKAVLQGPRALADYVEETLRRDHGSTDSIMIVQPTWLVVVLLPLLWARGRMAYPFLRRGPRPRWFIRIRAWRETGWRHFLTRQG